MSVDESWGILSLQVGFAPKALVSCAVKHAPLNGIEQDGCTGAAWCCNVLITQIHSHQWPFPPTESYTAANPVHYIFFPTKVNVCLTLTVYVHENIVLF